MSDQDRPEDEAPDTAQGTPDPTDANRDWLLGPEGEPQDAPAPPADPDPEPAPPEPGPEPPAPGPEPESPPEPEIPAPAPPAPPPPSPPRPGPPTPPPREPRPRRRRGLLWRLFGWLLIVVFVIPPAWVLFDRFVPPPATSLMLIRLAQGKGLDYRWRPLSRISPSFVAAAVAAEDARFCEHQGFDFEAIERAMAANERRPGRVRGGSTISQQTAKNVFLWPDRSWVRKGLEAYFTVLIEALWGKRRIMEVYLNIVELGPGIYGAEAAAQRYFGIPAAQLSPAQAARLAAVLPNPLRYKAGDPGPYVRRRSRRIGGGAAAVRSDGLAACVGKLSRVAPSRVPAPVRPPEGARPLPPPRDRALEAPAPADDALAPVEPVLPEATLDAEPAPATDAGQTPAAPEPAAPTPELRDPLS